VSVLPGFELHLGTPSVASLQVAARLVLFASEPKPFGGARTDPVALKVGAHSVRLAVEPGLRMGAASIGYDYTQLSLLPLLHVRADLVGARTWARPGDALPDRRTLVGGRVQVGFLLFSVRAGVLVDPARLALGPIPDLTVGIGM
jgi:hypothetical protein